MDAYDLQQELLAAWRLVSYKSDAGSIKKTFTKTPVYVNNQVVVGIRIEDNKIILETE
jgi:hypothetical protein